jgi:hypothetical protein
LRRDRKKLRAILPECPPLIDQSEIHLVDERRRLERLPSSFAAKASGRLATQLLINQRHQDIPSARVAGRPGLQQRRDVVTRTLRLHGLHPR